MATKETLTALEIAKIACDIETDGSDFYRAAAEASTDDETKKLFNELANREIEHLSTFRIMYKELNERMGGFPNDSLYLFDDTVTRYLKVISEGMIYPGRAEAQKWISQYHDIKDIIQFAIEAGKSTVLFFTDIMSHDTFVYSQEILTDIIRAEKSYIVSLNSMLNATNEGVLGEKCHQSVEKMSEIIFC
ncbi:MAG: rubrerythrin [Desulforhopalus sp.]|jgi:rubrerythrin